MVLQCSLQLFALPVTTSWTGWYNEKICVEYAAKVRLKMLRRKVISQPASVLVTMLQTCIQDCTIQEGE